MSFICYNGKFLPSDAPVFQASNRSYRYGAGLFETIRVRDSVILHSPKHFERLFNGISLLKFKPGKEFDINLLQHKIRELLIKNNCTALARVRLSVSSGDGDLKNTNEGLHYLIECWPLEKIDSNKKIKAGVYPNARKAVDIFSNLKTANFLPYVMSAEFAGSSGWDEAIVLNAFERVADSTSSNVFIIKNRIISTPPLSEGCVSGIYRGLLLVNKPKFEEIGYQLIESPVSVADLMSADEIFFTNSISGIKGISEFEGNSFPGSQTAGIINLISKIIPR